MMPERYPHSKLRFLGSSSAKHQKNDHLDWAWTSLDGAMQNAGVVTDGGMVIRVTTGDPFRMVYAYGYADALVIAH